MIEKEENKNHYSRQISLTEKIGHCHKQLTFESYRHVWCPALWILFFHMLWIANQQCMKSVLPRANIQWRPQFFFLLPSIDFLLLKNTTKKVQIHSECFHQLCSKCHGFITSISKKTNKLRAHVEKTEKKCSKESQTSLNI